MAAGFTKSDVEHVAALARLSLTPEEKLLFEQQLARILGYAEQVSSIDTSGVAATSALAGEPFDRPDQVRPSLDRDAALLNAPDAARDEGLFKVPRVLG